MESAKRSRLEYRSYNEIRNYRKRTKVSSGGSGKEEPVNALILDNGGYTIKIGYNSDPKPEILPNCIMKAKAEKKRVFIADQIEDCRDLSGLYYVYPHENGYITKPDIQMSIWDYTFNKFTIYDNTVMLTQPIFNFKTVQEFQDEIFFENYDVKSVFKANSTDYCYYKHTHQFRSGNSVSAVVVDSGFSFTHIIPYINGKKYREGIIRLNIGGKLLTNYLKDVLSYRQLHVMEETYVINQVKEDVCFMSQDFKADMRRAKATNDIVKNYVLPDFHSVRRGYIHDNPTAELQENCQILRLNNERITIPEVLMKPSIIQGFDDAGIAECILHSIEQCPREFQSEMAENIILVGGTTLFPGFRERIEMECRMFLPCDYAVNICQPEHPLQYAWEGGKLMASDPSLRQRLATKLEYEEEGSTRIYEKFNEFYNYEESQSDKSDSEDFSYLNYWKNEGVDIFQKEPLAPVKDPSIQFKLEGDNLEEYDGKFVTLDFEIEKPIEEIPDEAVSSITSEDGLRLVRRKRVTTPQLTPISPTTVLQTTPKLITIASIPPLTPTLTTLTTTVTSRTLPTLTSISPQLISTVNKAGQIVINQKLLQAARVATTPNVLNGNIILPKLTRIQPKLLRPIYKTVQQTQAVATKPQGKITQYISLGSNLNLSGLSVVTTAASHSSVARSVTPNILNNAVIVPQNMLASKNLTFQIIPIKPDLVRQGNLILAQNKQQQHDQ